MKEGQKVILLKELISDITSKIKAERLKKDAVNGLNGSIKFTIYFIEIFLILQVRRAYIEFFFKTFRKIRRI